MHYAWVVAILAMLVVLGAVGLARFAFGMLLPAMAADLVLDYREQGLLGASYFVGYLAIVALMPALAPRLGSRRLCAGGLLVVSGGLWAMALVTGFSLFIWMDIAALLFFGFLGISALSAPELLQVIFTTPMGLLFLVIGNAVGAVIALAVFSFSVTSFPMLFDRDVDFVTAMITSVKVVLANRTAMIVWCATIAGLIGISLLSGLIGLFVILPILGHASWHLYRRAIPPAPEST